MNEIWLVTKREFLVQTKKKSFILLTLFTPLLIVGIIVLIAFLSSANKEVNNIAVIDNSSLFYDAFETNEETTFTFFDKVEEEKIKDSLRSNDAYQGLLIIPKVGSDYSEFSDNIKFLTNKNLGVSFISTMQDKISNRIESLNLQKRGIDQETLQNAKVNVALDIQKVVEGSDATTATNQLGETIKTFMSYALMYIVFTFIMMYGVRVMRSVIEEKSNRVVEIIISSVKPFNLMMGKILGTTLVALTQFTVWIVIVLFGLIGLSAYLGNTIDTSELQDTSQMPIDPALGSKAQDVIEMLFSLNYPMIILVFLLFFFLGYLLYSSFFAAIGSTVDSETETQQFTWIGILPLSVGVYGAFTLINNPDGPIGFWMSMVPLTSPIVMVARIPFGVPLWEIILSATILILSIILVIYLAAKIYRVGILMYGKKPSLMEWIKWIKY